MVKRLKNQESLVDSTFSEMRVNMDSIKSNYKTVQEIQSA
jgi:hypothetical protein